MKQNLTLILMNEAVREGWREWMEKVRRVLPQTDAERPVTWIAAERLARENWKSHATLTLLATQDLPTFGYNMIDPLKSWCWGSILFYPFKISRFS